MVDVRQLAPGETDLYKAIRLAALEDAPCAFGSNYEREQAFPREKWERRSSEGWEGKGSICVVAIDGDRGVGIAGGTTPRDVQRAGQLVSLWVHADHRGTDVAARLVAQVEVWSFDRGHEQLLLGVTERNDRATRFFTKLGYVPYDDCLEGEDCIHILSKPLAVT